MKLIYSIAIIGCLFLFSCDSKPSLQKYFVENTDNKNFIAVDVSSNILNVDKTKLTLEQRNAMQSFDKMNVLAYKLNDKNKAEFEVERTKLNSILKDEKYQQLMKISSGKEGAVLSYVGSDENINEFVLYGNQNKTGFVVIRILGKDMNPSNIMSILSVIQISNIDMEQLKPLQEILKK